MRTLLYFMPGIAVMALAFWTYSENFETHQAVREAETLRARIGAQQSRLAILRAEWAYLNRPERLRDLAELNFSELRLLPLGPQHFGEIDEIPYPAQDFSQVRRPVAADGADLALDGDGLLP